MSEFRELLASIDCVMDLDGPETLSQLGPTPGIENFVARLPLGQGRFMMTWLQDGAFPRRVAALREAHLFQLIL
jgi:hypothetical protein